MQCWRGADTEDSHRTSAAGATLPQEELLGWRGGSEHKNGVALAEDPNSVSSAYFRQIPTPCNSSSRWKVLFCPPWASVTHGKH